MTQHRAEARYRREHGKEPAVLTTAGDIDALIDALRTGQAYHNMAQLHSLERPLLSSGYPDHELLVGVNRDLPVGVLAFMDGESGNLVTFDSAARRGEASYSITGQATEFPDRSEIPIELIRRAVKEFVFSGGKHPECVQWQVPEVW